MNHVCTKDIDKVIMLLVLYIDDILLIGNDVRVMSSVKIWLSSQYDIKELGKANFILGIKLWQDRKNRMLVLSLTSVFLTYQSCTNSGL